MSDTACENSLTPEKRVHDLRNALRSLAFFVEAVEEGYRFEDELAAAKIVQLRKILAILEREIPEHIAQIDNKT